MLDHFVEGKKGVALRQVNAPIVGMCGKAIAMIDDRFAVLANTPLPSALSLSLLICPLSLLIYPLSPDLPSLSLSLH